MAKTKVRVRERECVCVLALPALHPRVHPSAAHPPPPPAAAFRYWAKAFDIKLPTWDEMHGTSGSALPAWEEFQSLLPGMRRF